MSPTLTNSILTSLAYLILSPICFSIFNTAEIHREGALIYILVIQLALITSITLLTLSLFFVGRKISNRLGWMITQIVIGVLVFETVSLLFADSSLLYGFLKKPNWFQFGLSIGNLAALIIVHGVHFLINLPKKTS